MTDRNVQYPTRYRMTKVAGTDDIYEMEPVPGDVTDEGTIINKAALLKDATAAMYGFTSEQLPGVVPDDIFALLGPYTQYWWKATGKGYVEHLGDPARVLLTRALAVQSIYYADKVSINFSTGEVALITPQKVQADYTSTSPLNVLKGKYFANAIESPNNIYFAAQDAAITTEQGSGYYYVFLSNCSIVTSVLAEGETTYLHSANRNAYPDSGIVDDVEYQSLGKPLDNAVGAPTIETGFYVGTGTYGVDSPNTLALNGVPLFVIVYKDGERGLCPFTEAWRNSFSWIVNQLESRIYTNASSNGYIVFSQEGNSLSWYTRTTGVAFQLNENGVTYHYLAFTQ